MSDKGWFTYNPTNPREHPVDCNDYLVLSVLLTSRGIGCVVEKQPNGNRTMTCEGGVNGSEGCVFTFNKDGALKDLKAF